MVSKADKTLMELIESTQYSPFLSIISCYNKKQENIGEKKAMTTIDLCLSGHELGVINAAITHFVLIEDKEFIPLFEYISSYINCDICLGETFEFIVHTSLLMVDILISILDSYSNDFSINNENAMAWYVEVTKVVKSLQRCRG